VYILELSLERIVSGTVLVYLMVVITLIIYNIVSTNNFFNKWIRQIKVDYQEKLGVRSKYRD
jgi:positive regulator of sigma E activity